VFVIPPLAVVLGDDVDVPGTQVPVVVVAPAAGAVVLLGAP
jgi:hypothetical protein